MKCVMGNERKKRVKDFSILKVYKLMSLEKQRFVSIQFHALSLSLSLSCFTLDQRQDILTLSATASLFRVTKSLEEQRLMDFVKCFH
jgi:hypothetical protein